jgi:hypothetical protein
LPFRKTTHFGDHSGEVEEVGIEGFCCMFRNRDCHCHSFAALQAARPIVIRSNFGERLRRNVSSVSRMRPVPMIAAEP